MSRRIPVVVAAAIALAAGSFGPLQSTLGAHGATTTSPIQSITFQVPPPIAPNGSLSAGQSLTVTAVAWSGPNGTGTHPGGVALQVSFSAATNGGTATAPGPGGTPTPITATPRSFATNAAGQVVMTYTVGSAPPSSGSDTITVQDPSGAASASDSYTYDRTLSFTPNPIPTSASPGLQLHVSPAGVTPVFLKLVHLGTGAAGTAVVGTTQVTSTFKSFPTDPSGTLAITYTEAGGPTGTDVFTAQDSPSNPVSSVTDVHQYPGGNGTPDGFAFSKNPIAKPGSLAATPHTSTFSVEVQSAGAPVSGASLTLCLAVRAQGHGTGTPAAATVTDSNGHTNLGLPACPAQTASLTADANGHVSVTYTAEVAGGPTGEDVVNAQSGGANGADYYDYAAVSSYLITHISPSSTDQNNIAPPAQLGPSGTASFNITAKDSTAGTGNPVPNALVYVSFTSTTGGGTASVGTTTLTSQPQAFQTTTPTPSPNASPGGSVNGFQYTAPATLPASGQDVITMSTDPAATNGTVIQRLVYDFSVVNGYTFQATPISSNGTVTPGGNPISVLVTPTTSGGANAPSNTNIFLTFAPAGTTTATKATAKVGNAVLNGTPQAFPVDVNRNVTISYTPPPTSLPTSGSDVLTAVDAPSNASATATDTYSYATNYTFSASPIAATGILAPGSHVGLSLNLSPGSPAITTAFLSLASTARTPGGGSPGAATATCTEGSVTLTSTLQQCTSDATGIVPIAFTTSDPLPAGGTDTITAQNQPGAPTIVVNDSYSYVGQYLFFHSPIAPDGTLNTASNTPFTVTVSDSGSNPVGAGVPVFLNLQPSGAANGTVKVGTTALTATPQSFPTDGNGRIVLNYATATGALPNNGVDIVTAANDASATPSLAASDGYIYGNVVQYTFNLTPLAPQGSLNPGQKVPFTLQASDAAGAPITGVHDVYLAIQKTSGGGSAAVTRTGFSPFPLTGTLTRFSTAADGTLPLTYTVPSKLPVRGADLVVATDSAGSTASAVGITGYVFGTQDGYWLVASDGGIFPFGSAGTHSYGSTGGQHLNRPIVGMAPTPSGLGYWLVASDGGIFPFGDAGGFGSTGGIHLNQPIVGMAATPTGNGYWLVASDGGIFPFGDAVNRSYGSTGGIHLNQPIVGMTSTADGLGYFLVAADGGLFPFGDAVNRSYGSTGGSPLNKPIVGMAATPDGFGYWLVASDGGIFPFGDAGGFGSTGGIHLNQPIVGMAATPNGGGYWLVASDGGIFPFGNAAGLGSTGGIHLNQPIVGMAVLGG